MAADTPPPEHLFVYGTLLSEADHPMGRLLRTSARLVGPARLRGRLYLVESFTGPGGTERPSHYPACVASDDPGDEVHGELYAISNTGVLDALDAYEECGPDFPEPREYVRALCPVETEGGGIVQAWVYFYNYPVDALRPIEGGRWPVSG